MSYTWHLLTRLVYSALRSAFSFRSIDLDSFRGVYKLLSAFTTLPIGLFQMPISQARTRPSSAHCGLLASPHAAGHLYFYFYRSHCSYKQPRYEVQYVCSVSLRETISLVLALRFLEPAEPPAPPFQAMDQKRTLGADLI